MTARKIYYKEMFCLKQLDIRKSLRPQITFKVTQSFSLIRDPDKHGGRSRCVLSVKLFATLIVFRSKKN